MIWLASMGIIISRVKEFFPSVILERALPVILKMNVNLLFSMPLWFQACYMFS